MTRERDRLAAVARSIFAAGVRAADPFGATAQALAAHPHLFALRPLLVVGAGKAAAAMAHAAEKELGDRIVGGLVVVPDGVVDDGNTQLPHIELVAAGHPLPDARGATAAHRILDLMTKVPSGTDVLFLLSGGASALLPAPARGIALAEKVLLTRLLLDAGADIAEVNTVRKHISAIKGGRLAAAAYPARVITLCVSDVIGGAPDVIGSGPTAGDPTTFAQARAVLVRHGVWERAPASVRVHIERGARGDSDCPETPKPGDPRLAATELLICADNAAALAACVSASSELGLPARLWGGALCGEAREVGAELARMAAALPAPGCLVAGGETTVTVRGHGRGGRNQELALAAAIELDGIAGRDPTRAVTLLSAGTDGIDGPTDAAGAIAHGDSLARARALGIDAAAHLADNNSYAFFDRLGDLVRTGPTGTNVMDVQLLLVAPA